MRNWNDDPFTKKARKENYEARSVYKLKEIDDKEQMKAEKVYVKEQPARSTAHCSRAH